MFGICLLECFFCQVMLLASVSWTFCEFISLATMMPVYLVRHTHSHLNLYICFFINYLLDCESGHY